MNHQTQFPVPFTLDELRQDILTLHLHHLRISSLFATDESSEAVFSLIGKQPSEACSTSNLWTPERDGTDLGIEYREVARSNFSRTMEQLYAYAFHGEVVSGPDSLGGRGTLHTWVAAYLRDVDNSGVVVEWTSHGGSDPSGAAARCWHTCKLANARLILEQQEGILPLHEDGAEEGALSIHQVALLAGMEEMSVRTAASRKGPNQLPTFKREGQTRVRPEDALRWLKAKRRYVPVTDTTSVPGLQLERVRFESLAALNDAMRVYMDSQGIGQHAAQMRKKAGALLGAPGHREGIALDAEAAEDKALLKKLATLLKLPAELFALRVEQTLHVQRLRALELEIQQATDSRA